jgi:uncharacterized protein YciI
VFLVLTSYRVTFEPDDPRVQAHRGFLREQAAAGRVLVSGPRHPRTGGVTVFNVETVDELQDLLGRDTMRQAGMIDDEIIEFNAVIAADERRLDPSPDA